MTVLVLAGGAGARLHFGKMSHIASLGRSVFHGASDMMQVEELDASGNLVRILRVPGYPLDLCGKTKWTSSTLRCCGLRATEMSMDEE